MSVAQDGTIAVNGATVTKLGLAVFTNPKVDLVRDTGNMFTSAAKPTTTNAGVIVQSTLESSNTDPTQVMTQLVGVARSYEADQQMVQNEDSLTGKTIATLGHVG